MRALTVTLTLMCAGEFLQLKVHRHRALRQPQVLGAPDRQIISVGKFWHLLLASLLQITEGNLNVTTSSGNS